MGRLSLLSRAVGAYTDQTRKLADLIVGFGANVQPGQLVGITTSIGKEELTRELARAAYARGAHYVDALYSDELVKRERLLGAADDTLEYIPPWLRERLVHFSDRHAARISLSGPQAPHALNGIAPGRTGRDLLPYLPETGEIIRRGTTNWCVAPAPTAAWAGVVYPDLPPEAALERLWETIVHVCRLDADDPAAAWRERATVLERGAALLTERHFATMHLHGPGTDLTVGLLASSTWHAAGSTTVDGLEHFSNIPSEETFRTPDPTRVDGHVSATLPLDLFGTTIRGIRVEFEGGRAVKIDADDNAEALRAVCAKDDGGTRLGELALVDSGGRIGPLQTVFHTTLLDENAASHIALGSGYDLAVADEADRARVNRSQIHVDFMIGSPTLNVDGITHAGEHVPVLRNGAWQL